MCLTLCDPMDCSTPGFSVLHYLLELGQTHIHWVGSAIQPSHSLSPPSSPALDLSQQQGLFQWVGSLHQVAKVLEGHSPNEYSRLISFRIDWFDLLALQRTQKSSALQFESISSLVLSLLYGPTLSSIHDYWKTIVLTIWTFVSKVLALLLWLINSLVNLFWRPIR